MRTKKARIKRWPIYTLSVAFLVPIGLASYVYYKIHYTPHVPTQDELTAALINSIFGTDQPADMTHAEGKVWRDLFPETIPMTIAGVTVYAAVADSWPERIRGLSNTPYLPEEVVKLFVFDTAGLHAIWMKDMNYAIDIIWLDEAGKVVSLVNEAAPESYPEAFIPDAPAVYVIETVAGFVAKHEIAVGDFIELPAGL